MKSFSNRYIYIFSATMVVIVATLLAFISLQLKPAQERNILTEKMQNILASVRVQSTTSNAQDLFDKYITGSIVLNNEGKILENTDAFDVDLVAQVSKIEKTKQLKSLLAERRVSPFKQFIASFGGAKETDRQGIQSQISAIGGERQLPVYICTKEDSSVYYIFPVRGKGLWGPVWGYISLEADMNTIYGAVFDHKSETPGLGAEINQEWFQVNFRGKKLFDGASFRSIEVAKKGTVEPSPFTVDAISGGTITSKGVEAMLYDCLEGYIPYFETQKN
ncbi:MAG: NADH:ubiquinone reductase (Na(+)-transporting) subunit C [Bacteroidales bacterium]|nr:NADH:ubiquinone reductase (Na(+)-transporting) subunit C [Bacteroidales bacterium]